MSEASDQAANPTWQPLSRTDRRVVGVLVEKAKTTPDQYPLSLNALTNGCNQKSNRSPQMNLEQHEVEDSLERLRALGAAAEVQGGSRVAKFRHYMQEWLGVSGPELAVMAELLLRGAQTIGELRGRANRMTRNEIPDVAALRPLIQSLLSQGLMIPLTPAGRGQVVTHALYNEDELAKLKREHSTPEGLSAEAAMMEMPAPSPVHTSPDPPATGFSTTVADAPQKTASTSGDQGDLAALRREVTELRSEVANLKKEIEDLWASVR